MKQDSQAPRVQWVRVGENQVGQRVDNFLMSRLKGLPKSRLYRLIRKGEVRVNKKRVKPEHKLGAGDEVRIPPVRISQPGELPPPTQALCTLICDSLLFEDEDLLIFNKPSGLPVHAGTGVKAGLIETLRHIYADEDFLELVHRLDKGTSGCIMVAKNARTLKRLSEQLKERLVHKVYHALVTGCWPDRIHEVGASLQKGPASGGSRKVAVDKTGKAALTRFSVLRRGHQHTLLEARPVTGRTHQIRVHAQLAGHPVVGDEKYQLAGNRGHAVADMRLCLHAAALELEHPPGQTLCVQASYDAPFNQAVETLTSAED